MNAQKPEQVSVSEMTVPKLVRIIRSRDGLSLEGLGRILGVSYVTVSHWQSGKRVPQARHLRRIRELARNDMPDVTKTQKQVLVVAPKAEAAAVLSQMVRDAAAVLGVDVNVTDESDGMKALMKVGSLNPAVMFLAYPIAGLDVTHLIDTATEGTGAAVELFVLIGDGKTAAPAPANAHVFNLTTPITLASIGEALRLSSLTGSRDTAS